MIDPVTINPWHLPSYSFSYRHLLPSLPGLYFVINLKNELIYIGRALDIKSRWAKPHYRRPEVTVSEEIRIAWLVVEEARNLRELESVCVSYFKLRCDTLLNNKQTIYKPREKEIPLYEKDFYLWCDRQSELLERREYNRLDIYNIFHELGGDRNRGRAEICPK